MVCWDVFAHVTRDLANFRVSLKFWHSQFFDFHGSGTRLSANVLPRETPYLIEKTLPQGFLVSIREGRGEKGGGERVGRGEERRERRRRESREEKEGG